MSLCFCQMVIKDKLYQDILFCKADIPKLKNPAARDKVFTCRNRTFQCKHGFQRYKHHPESFVVGFFVFRYFSFLIFISVNILCSPENSSSNASKITDKFLKSK